MTFLTPDTSHLYHSLNGYQTVQAQYNRMLTDMATEYESFHVNTRHGHTHVFVAGAAHQPPLLLIHGLANPSVMWKPNIPYLARHFQVFAVDVVGDAGRSAGSRPSMLDGSYANWLVDVLDELNIVQANLVGMSLGGWITLNTMLYHPERVARTILLAPAGFVTLNTSLITQAAFSLPLFQTRFSIPSLLARIARHAEHDVQRLIYLVAQHHRAKPVPPVPILSDGDLKRITTPTIVLMGDEDEMFSTRGVTRRAPLMPGFAGMSVIAGAGHGVNATHPAQLAAYAQSFFC